MKEKIISETKKTDDKKNEVIKEPEEALMELQQQPE
jgi:hypothetical protein